MNWILRRLIRIVAGALLDGLEDAIKDHEKRRTAERSTIPAKPMRPEDDVWERDWAKDPAAPPDSDWRPQQ